MNYGHIKSVLQVAAGVGAAMLLWRMAVKGLAAPILGAQSSL
jgi:hypothetical protein